MSGYFRCRAPPAGGTYLQQQDEVVHRLVAGVQVVAGAQPVVGFEVHLLVDTGVAQEVEQNLLGHPGRAEVLHLCRARGHSQHLHAA